MQLLLIALVVAFGLFAGVGSRYRDRLGAYYASGSALLGLLVLIFIGLVLLGAIQL